MQQLTKLGVTLGQLGAIVVFLGGIIGFVINDQMNTARIEQRVIGIEQSMEEMKRSVTYTNQRFDEMIYEARRNSQPHPIKIN